MQKITNKERARTAKYAKYEKIFLGDHKGAFAAENKQLFGSDYNNIRYVIANFGGMLSKLSADMLFEEFPKITLPDGDNDFLKALFEKNALKTQMYESALENSFRGDAVFEVKAVEGEIVIEDLNPTVYFPEYNENNVREEPVAHVLRWEIVLAGHLDGDGKPRRAMYQKRHTKGQIENTLHEIDASDNVIAELPIESYMPNIKKIELTGVDDFLIVHIPNYRINSTFFGLSDYIDLESLLVAINNRITKVDNILDKHGDPILAVPPGVLDEEGKVRKESFGVIEVDTSEAGGSKPEYIVWDAKLESAFMQVDKLVDMLFITSETSFAAFGIDNGKGGQAESGRALKFKLLRTLAKKKRKALYYTQGIKQLLFTAQEFAQANNLTANNTKLGKKPVVPQIEWQDGVVNDAIEQIEVEERKLDSQLTSRVDSIMRLEGITLEEALEKIKQMDTENKEMEPKFAVAPIK